MERTELSRHLLRVDQPDFLHTDLRLKHCPFALKVLAPIRELTLVAAEVSSGALSVEYKDTVSTCFELAAEALRAALSDGELPDGAGDFVSASYDVEGGFGSGEHLTLRGVPSEKIEAAYRQGEEEGLAIWRFI